MFRPLEAPVNFYLLASSSPFFPLFINTLKRSLNVRAFLLIRRQFFMIFSMFCVGFVLFSLFSKSRASNRSYRVGSCRTDDADDVDVDCCSGDGGNL